MRILITGAEGFVGRNLQEHFSRNASVEEVFAPTFNELDLRATDDVKQYMSGKEIDVIVHSATTMPKGKAYPPTVCEDNLRMFFNLLRGMGSSMRLINLGSGSEYSREYWHSKISEEFFDSHVPNDPHSYSKYVISKYIINNDRHDLLTLRIFGVFGKYEDYRYKFISNTIAKNLLGLSIDINRNAWYDYLDVADLCRIVEFFTFNDHRHADYNVTPTESIELTGIPRLVNGVAHRPSAINVLNEGLGTPCTGRNDRLLKELGDFRFTSYAESISALFEHYASQIHGLDRAALVNDDFLNYAKSLQKQP